jgi:hypothetical protein
LDRNLAFTYGKIAKILIENGLTGFCPSVRGLTRDTKDWFPLAIPFTHMLEIKEKSKINLIFKVNMASTNRLFVLQMLT